MARSHLRDSLALIAPRLVSSQAGGTSKGTLWLCSDLLLMGRLKGASYSLLEQSAVGSTNLERLEPAVVRLSCESGATYLLLLSEGSGLFTALEAAQVRAARAITQVGDAVEDQHLDDSTHERSFSIKKEHLTSPSWTMRLRLRMSAAAKELSAGSFGRKKRNGVPLTEAEVAESVLSAFRSRRRATSSDSEKNIAGEREVRERGD